MLTYDERVFELNDNLDLETEVNRDLLSGRRIISYGEFTIVPGDHVTNIFDASFNRRKRIWGSTEDAIPEIESFFEQINCDNDD